MANGSEQRQFIRIALPGEAVPARLKGAVVAIGNFDGVHRGHRAVLNRVLAIARERAAPALVLTFEPHPRSFFAPDNPVYRLTPADLKAQLFAHLGFDGVIEQVFDAGFAGQSADDFVRAMLVGLLGVSCTVTGHDFHFGARRQGTPDYLAQAGQEHGFDVVIVEPFGDTAGQIVSSTRIRQALRDGDVGLASHLLGYAYRVHARVERGRQMGRELGYPTANLSLPAQATLRHGIYAVRVILEDGSIHDGVASHGRRPTFDNGEVLLESHLFDFDGDLYGKPITVLIYGWLRAEEKFESAEALVAQMHKDAAQARKLLAAMPADYLLWPGAG